MQSLQNLRARPSGFFKKEDQKTKRKKKKRRERPSKMSLVSMCEEVLKTVKGIDRKKAMTCTLPHPPSTPPTIIMCLKRECETLFNTKSKETVKMRFLIREIKQADAKGIFSYFVCYCFCQAM